MIFDSGSVKFRCAVGLGANGSRPSRGARGLLALRLKLSAPRGLRLARLSLKCLLRLFDLRQTLLATLKLLGLERLLRLLDLRQTLLATLQLLGQLIAAAIRAEALILLRVDLLGLGKQRRDVRSDRSDLSLKLGLLLDHPLVAHRLMPRGIRTQLRPIQRQAPKPDELRLLAQPQRLHEQLAQRLQMPLAEPCDRTVIRMLIG